MNTKQLKYVLVLAQEGSFSKAADRLNISQPSLSQYIKKMETELGISLFDRSGGWVRLTDAGKVCIETGQKILELERNMERRFSDLMTYQTGTIVVGLSAHRSVKLMPRVAAEFQKRYPGMVLRLEERPRPDLMEAASRGEFDLCVTTLPVEQSLFAAETLFHEEMILAVPTDSDLCRTLSAHAEPLEDRHY